MTQNTPTIYQRLEKLEGELQKLTNRERFKFCVNRKN